MTFPLRSLRACRCLTWIALSAAAALAAAAQPALADRAWGEGDFYTFATDADGWSIVEPGQTHRVIYVSATGISSNTGLTADSPVSIERGLAMVRPGSSDWLLLKRGDDFGSTSIRLRNQFNGESALNPIVIGAYGEGDRPILGGSLQLYDTHTNLVIRDLQFIKSATSGDHHAIDILGNTSNVLIENVRFEGRESRMHSNNRSVIHHITLRRNVMLDTHRNHLQNTPHADRTSGWYISTASHVLLEQNIFDHNGWEAGYTGDPTHRQLQEPSMYSHNLYVGHAMHDMTVRDNITTRGASMGFKLVSPGVIEGNVLVANNLAMGINDGDQSASDPGDGDFLVLRDNVSLHGADKAGTQIGARGWGLTMGEPDSADNGVIRGNVEAHSNAVGGGNTLAVADRARMREFVNNVVHNWRGQPNLNPTPGSPYPDASRTIMSYMASLGEAGSLDAFYAAIRGMSQDNWDSRFEAAAIVRYIQEGFGVSETGRTTSTRLTFASAGTDDVRWDNRANWSTNDRPIHGDEVDLNGATVNFSSVVALSGLDVGDGLLRVSGGLLEVMTQGGFSGGGDVQVTRSGQFVVRGRSAGEHVGIHLAEGRFRNTGRLAGAYTLAITGGSAEVIGGEHGADMVIGEGSRMMILGREARVGGYGSSDGQMSMTEGGRLDFIFDRSGVSTLRALAGASGRLTFDADADHRGATVLGLDVSELVLSSGLHSFHLIDFDGLDGEFGQFSISGLGVNGINGLHLLWDQANGSAILTVAVNDGRVNGFVYEAALLPEPASLTAVAMLATLAARRR